MKNVFMMLSSLIFSSIANAASVSVVLGAGQTTMDVSQFPAYAAPQVTATTGIQGGFNVDFPIGTMFSFTTGVLYVQRNSQYGFSTGGGQLNINYSYVDIPLHFHLWLDDFTIIAGASAGVKAGSSYSGSGIYSNAFAGTTFNDKSIIVPGQIGLGYFFGKMVLVQALYEPSINLTVLTQPGSSANINTSSIDLRVGYVF